MVSAEFFTLAVPFGEKVLRTIAVYGALLALLRIFGKRELAQLNRFDLVVLLTLSNTVQNALIGPDNSVTGGLLGALTLLAVNWGVVRLLYRRRRLDELVEGRATVLIHGGKLQTANLRKELLSVTELRLAAQRQGFDGLAEVEECYLEPGGGLMFRGKRRGLDEAHFRELVTRLERIESVLRTR